MFCQRTRLRRCTSSGWHPLVRWLVISNQCSTDICQSQSPDFHQHGWLFCDLLFLKKMLCMKFSLKFAVLLVNTGSTTQIKINVAFTHIYIYKKYGLIWLDDGQYNRPLSFFYFLTNWFTQPNQLAISLTVLVIILPPSGPFGSYTNRAWVVPITSASPQCLGITWGGADFSSDSYLKDLYKKCQILPWVLWINSSFLTLALQALSVVGCTAMYLR